MLRTKANVAGLVVLLVIPAECIETGRAGLGIEPDRGKQPAAGLDPFIAAPLPWLGTVVTWKPADRIWSSKRMAVTASSCDPSCGR